MRQQSRHRQVAAQAIDRSRQVRWKPDKGQAHLLKRKALRHLPETATLEDYERLIRELLEAPANRVYHYPAGGEDFYAVAGEVEGISWLVIFSHDGILETAFPPDDLNDYLTRRGFRGLGQVEEIEARES